MLTRDDVRHAYRYILGREPENEAVLDSHLKHVADRTALRLRLMGAPEFYRTHARDILRYFAVWQARRQHGVVEYDCAPADLDRLFAHIKAVWSRLGEVEPHFSVVSTPNFKPEKLDANMASFLRSGKGEADLLGSELAGLGLKPTGYSHCVELGCGVGRVTRYLADRAVQVTGLDISMPHLRLARDYMNQEQLHNVALEQVTEPAKVALPACDLFYSRIVLQHNPPPVQLFLIRRALEALVPGGVAVFQVPTYIEGYEFRVGTYLAGMHKIDNQELHALPERAIFRAVSDSNCDVLSSYRDNSLSRITQVSNRFVIQKR